MDLYSEDAVSLENSAVFDSFLENELGLNLNSSLVFEKTSCEAVTRESQSTGISTPLDDAFVSIEKNRSYLENVSFESFKKLTSSKLATFNSIPTTDTVDCKPRHVSNVSPLPFCRDSEADLLDFSEAKSFESNLYKVPDVNAFKNNNFLTEHSIFQHKDPDPFSKNEFRPVASLPFTTPIESRSTSTPKKLLFNSPPSNSLNSPKITAGVSSDKQKDFSTCNSQTKNTNRHQLLPSLPFKSYEDFHRNRLNRQQYQSRKNNLNCSKAHTSSEFKKFFRESHTNKDGSFLEQFSKVSNLYNISPESKPIVSQHLNTKDDCFSKVSAEAFTTNIVSNQVNCIADHVLEKKNLSRLENSEPSKEIIQPLPIAANFHAPVNSPTNSSLSEGTSTLSEASPKSENILTDSILNLFQLNDSFCQTSAELELNKSPKNGAKYGNHKQNLQLSDKDILNPIKTSKQMFFTPISFPSNVLPPEYSVSDNSNTKGPKINHTYNQLFNNSKVSYEGQAVLERLDKVIETQQHCVNLLKEIRDKLPFSVSSISLIKNLPASNELLIKIQHLQDQLCSSLNELNLHHATEAMNSFQLKSTKRL